MFKVNLQEKLTKNNVNLLNNKELLILKETDKFVSENDVNNMDINTLKEIGFNNLFRNRDSIKYKINTYDNIFNKFPKEKIFEIKQIEKICKNYKLKFLNTILYSGNLPKELPSEITKFKSIYLKKSDEINSENFFIMAPQENFKLLSKPKDPLLFYKINKQYYFLIYKWGNDLSILRRLQGFINKNYLRLYSFINSIIFLFSLSIYFYLSGLEFFSNFNSIHKNDAIYISILVYAVITFLSFVFSPKISKLVNDPFTNFSNQYEYDAY